MEHSIGFDEEFDDWHKGEDPFANPGGTSALRIGRCIYPCPTCGEPGRLTAIDVSLGYQCDVCADLAEQGW